MTVSGASEFTGSIPDYYDRGLGPVLFDPYARDIAARVAAVKPRRVLELAAGTGIVTRKLRDALPAATPIMATDLNPAMLEIAQRKFRGGENVEFSPADAMALPFADGAFDLTVCQFGVMFFPDKVASFREARRVLSPCGRYIFNVWGTHAANPFAAIMYQMSERLFPTDPPQFYAVPFSYSDPREPLADAKAGGFADVKFTSLKIVQTVADWPLFADGLVRGNPIIAEIEARDHAASERFREAVIAELRARFGPEPAQMPLQAFVFECK